MSTQRPLSVLHPLSPHLMFFELGGLFALDAGLTRKWIGEDWAFSWALTLLAGVLGIFHTAWCWRGRSARARSWAQMQWGANLAIIGVPFLAFPMFAIGLRGFLELPKPIAGIPLLACAWLFVVLVAGAFSKDLQHSCPKWWGPRWFRTGEYKRRDKRPWDPLGTVLGTGSPSADGHGVTLEVHSKELAREFGAGAAPVESWSGGWVHDPDTDEQDHSAARKGTVEGTISWFPHGLVFAASTREDLIRNRNVVMTIPADQITEITVVPARAGADGRQRPGIAHRSPFPRLVVHTTSVSYVFDIAGNNAKNAAKFLQQQVNQPS